MAATVEYFCQCNQPSSAPPPSHLPSSAYSFHPLQTLFFCEECDAVRCDSCVLVEVSGYYCPNCLFEVPSASVRSEKNRCARNCFLCPLCSNTLSVVASDPPDTGDMRSTTSASVGEPPFFLYCNHCRWDSADVGVTFEKPTGLAGQLQKHEDSAPEALEFERLKEHFEPLLRAATSSTTHSAHIPHSHSNPITAAASNALARDIPGVARYNPLTRSHRRDKTAPKDEMPEYRSRLDVASVGAVGAGGEADVDFLRHLETVDEVASLDQRWFSSWAAPLQMRDLRPQRIPLQTKKTKRCATCKHILIKPEQKAQSVRYKIKLVAANYLPAIIAAVPGQRGASMHAGRTYPFTLAFTNPLYDPIQVRMSTQRAANPESRPPFAVTLPNSAFTVAAFAEAWEYDDDEEMEDDYEDVRAGLGRERTGHKSARTVGVLEKKANVTIVGGEVVIGKAAVGNIKFNMLISYTYRSDDPVDEDEIINTPSRSKTAEMKTFSFSVVVDLGPTIPKEDQPSEAMDTS